MESKCEKMKKLRLSEYKKKASELDEKERNLRKKTNQLVDEVVANSDDTPFHEALIKVLGNLKGKNYPPYIHTKKNFFNFFFLFQRL